MQTEIKRNTGKSSKINKTMFVRKESNFFILNFSNYSAKIRVYNKIYVLSFVTRLFLKSEVWNARGLISCAQNQ